MIEADKRIRGRREEREGCYVGDQQRNVMLGDDWGHLSDFVLLIRHTQHSTGREALAQKGREG